VLINNIRKSINMLFLTLFFLLIGSISLSSYSDYESISVNFGNSGNWTTGWRTYYVFFGGLANTSLLIGLISSVISFVFFILFVINCKTTLKGIVPYLTSIQHQISAQSNRDK
jgi:hypothetical protein